MKISKNFNLTIVLLLCIYIGGTSLYSQIAIPESDRYIIMMKDKLNLDKSNVSKRSKLEFLRKNSKVSQNSLLSLLSKYKSFNVKSLYTINAILATISKEEMKVIKSRDDIKKIIPDTPVFIPRTFPGKRVEGDYGDYTFGLFNIGIPEIRKSLNITGRNVLIGHIDTGVDATHPDLVGKILHYIDLTSSNTDPTDTQGHGTHTAATIVGGKASGKYIGVAPDAKLAVARGIGSSSKLLESMEWMFDPDGNPDTMDLPKAVSCSWHSGYGDQTAYYAMIEKWIGFGIIPCFSAGNSGPKPASITKPKEHPGTFANAAVDNKDAIASFSSRGPGMYKGSKTNKPDFAAPGKDVYSAKSGGGYTSKSGTSMACPHTAGVIALLFEANPDLTVDQVRDVLTATAVDLGDEGYDYNFGHGRIDAYSAVSLAMSGGKLIGTVKDSSEKPVKARVFIKQNEKEYFCNNEGSFLMFLPEGRYDITFSAFAYLNTSISITIKKDQTQNVDIILNNAPSVKISGTITSDLSGEPLKAKINLVNFPDMNTTAEETGDYSLELPSGKYRLTVSCFGYETAISDPVTIQSNLTLDFQLSPLPPVLLVDDDKGKNYESYFKEALDKLNVKYNIWDISKNSDINENDILPYFTVIWFTGDDSSSTLTANDTAMLTKYLKSGGTLFLTGQEIGYNLKTKDFYKDILKAKYLKDDSRVKIVRGKGMTFRIERGNGADNQKYPDVIEPLKGATSYLNYDTDKGCAAIFIKNNVYKIVYLAFGFEGISTTLQRENVMKTILEDINNGLISKIKRIIRFSDSNPEIAKAMDIALAGNLDLYRSWELEDAKSFISNNAEKGSFKKTLEKIDNIFLNK
ncbi:S8 family serine peptidase [bacterium]|nr:S8 family serine peptidase [bacterium]